MAMGYWSDLPSDMVISIATRLSEPGDYARFRTVCRSWESAVRGFRPSFFPWLAAIPDRCDPNKDDLSFFSNHARSNDCTYKRRIGMPLCGGGDIIFSEYYFSSSKNGWMVFVRRDDGVPIIVNPLTGAQLIQPLPSLHTLSKLRRLNIESIAFFPDNDVAIMECRLEQDYHIAVAAPGDDEWSATGIFELWLNSSIVFHETDNKFYILNRKGNMCSFRLIRCGRKTIFGEVSSILAKPTGPVYLTFYSRLMFDGTSLLQVRQYCTSKKFDILKYNPDAYMWVKMTDMDFGNNTFFFDEHGAMMLPLPLSCQNDKEGRLRRNCIYFTNGEIKNGQYIHCVGMYDMGNDTVEPFFSTINFRSYGKYVSAFMWFTPSLSINN